MSLATRCTACGTVFRVVQDQLRVSDGWVRCGRCAEVFNAIESLVELDAEGVPQDQPSPHGQRVVEELARHRGRPDDGPATDPQTGVFGPPPQAVQAAGTDDFELDVPTGPTPAAAPEPFDIGVAADTSSDGQRTEPAFGHDAPAEPGPDFEHALVQDLATEASAAPAPDETVGRAEPAWIGLDEPVPSATGTLSADAPTPRHDDTALPVTMPAAPVPTPAFVQRADRAARWSSPRVRLTLAGLALVAATALALQVALEFRDRFAATWPASRALLEPLCRAAGCTIEPLRRIEGLAVESSVLTRVEGTTLMRLAVVLRNRDQLELMLPAFDLVLNDAQGRVVARRVLAAAELGATARTLASGAELPLAATLGTGDRSVVGYTIEIFYP